MTLSHYPTHPHFIHIEIISTSSNGPPGSTQGGQLYSPAGRSDLGSLVRPPLLFRPVHMKQEEKRFKICSLISLLSILCLKDLLLTISPLSPDSPSMPDMPLTPCWATGNT